jgi:2',3'-cyclic-nucleotide 2'-phosphodiesterase (5'-nucleotidase family)
MGGAIHGEFVRPDGNGGYQTVDQQRGKVTSVNSSSIEVKSDDGFTKTYTVDDNTLVNAGRDGIADVKKDDVVEVAAVVSGSTAKAVRIMDQTTLKALHDQWAPPRQRPQAQPQATNTAST